MKIKHYVLGVDTGKDTYRYFISFIGATVPIVSAATTYKTKKEAQESFDVLEGKLKNQSARLKEAVAHGIVSDYDTHFPPYVLAAYEKNGLFIFEVTTEVKAV